jgi:hypothetical protein
MAFTRFHDDPNRIKKQLQESSYLGRYMLNMPGNGVDLPFPEDPQIRLQGWGANLRTNTINLESDLLGLTRPLNRDLEGINNYDLNSTPTSNVNYKTTEPFVQESRATHPAWMYKDLDHTRWENPLLNPLDRIEKSFHDNIQTRILEKDYFVPRIPVVSGNHETDYYLTGKSVCIAGNEAGCSGTKYL